MGGEKKKAVGYDKYIDWKIFIIPVLLVSVMLIMPATSGMRDVGAEYSIGAKTVIKFIANELFQKKVDDLDQWELITAQVMENNMRSGAIKKKRFMERDVKWCKKNKIPASEKNVERAQEFMAGLDDARYLDVMKRSAVLRTETIDYNTLEGKDKEAAEKGAWQVKVALAVMVFTVLCFVTGCIPLPAVAFCIGLLLVFTGLVSNEDVAALYWSDACWFIMGSLMFAAAFVKTGVDKRICLFLFSKLARPSTGAITLVLIIVIAPAASFISDHALAAIFLPIAIILHRGSTAGQRDPDMELGKMLVITVAMACNIGGFGSPSGGARNVIMMTYLNDMFGIDIGYMQWITYAMPFVIVMIPLTWLMIRWRFKPKTTDLSPAMAMLKEEIQSMGPWSRQQIITLIIFVVMVFLWFTEKSFFKAGIFPIRMGIGVVAVAGAAAYIIAGVVNWRDYQEKVDWGVVWLYAGAIIFGKVLDDTGAAYFIARSAVNAAAQIGLDSGIALISMAGVLTAGMTQIMADGPAAAAVGPITLNMAGVAAPGTTMLPFMAMATAAASSFAYCLVIGTPPNAIVYASGYLEPKDYLRVGLPMWFVAIAVLLLMVAIYWAARGFTGMPAFC